MGAERLKVTFRYRCGTVVSLAVDRDHAYRIARQRYTRSETGAQEITYGLARVGAPALERLVWVAEADIRVCHRVP